MARCYSVPVPNRQLPLPRTWLISDARNDAAMTRTLALLPRGSGLIFRHYHLPPHARRARFEALARIVRRFGHRIVLAGTARQALHWSADGAYGDACKLTQGPATLRLITAHNLRELSAAHRARADAVLLSPIFPTRSHPGAPALGPVRFRLLAARARVPVIALGGMTARRARRLRGGGEPVRWAAIDGLSKPPTGAFPIHS